MIPFITPSQSAKGAAEKFCTITEHPEILKMPRRNLAQFYCAKFRLFLTPPPPRTKEVSNLS